MRKIWNKVLYHLQPTRAFRTMRMDRFSIELSAPLNPKEIPDYYKKFAHLLGKFTHKVSIASHSSGSIAGFDKTYNLVRYLNTQTNNKTDILVHLTCQDANHINIHSRLTLLESLNISRILALTGQDYIRPEKKSHLYFANSHELALGISESLGTGESPFSISFAAYPGGRPGESTRNDAEEGRRLMGKIGLAESVYTQCIFDPIEFQTFYETTKQLNPHLEIIPSVAIYDSAESLEKCFKLLRVKQDQTLTLRLREIDESDRRAFAKRNIVKLCKALRDRKPDICINICSFSLFDLTTEILHELCKDQPGQ